MNGDRLDKQMGFLLEIDKLKLVVRQNYLADGSRREDVAEHSWHLAMFVIILAEYFPGVNFLRAVKMALLHDLVEVYAGDTFAYDPEAQGDKEQRERAAAERIFGLLPADQAAEIMALWAEFEEGRSLEAICASVVDRMQPLALNSAAEGKMWRSCGVSVDMVRERNRLVFEHGPEVLADHVRRMIREAQARGCFPESGE